MPSRVRPASRFTGPVFVLLLGITVAAAAPAAPTGLKVDCTSPVQAPGTGDFQTNPTNCSDIRPYFQWTASGTNAFQIQVDQDSGFVFNSSCPWLWSSGTISGSASSIQYPGTFLGGCGGQSATAANQGPWRGAYRAYWHVRVSSDGGVTWSPWSANATFSYNTPPEAPDGFSLVTGSGGGAKESYGTTTRGTTFYVDAGHANRADSNACTSESAPCATIQGAVARLTAAGQTIRVKNGSYGNVCISSSGGVAGTRGQPIVIEAYPGHAPRLTGTGASCNGDTTAFGVGKPYYTVQGFTFDNGNGATYSFTTTAARTILRNNAFLGGNAGGVTPAMIMMDGDAPAVIGNTFNRAAAGSGCDVRVIYSNGSPDFVFRGNEVTGKFSRAVDLGGGQGSSHTTVIEENKVHGLTCAYGMAFSFYYGTGPTRVARNLIDYEDGAVRFGRGSWGDVYHNTITSGWIITDNADGSGNVIRDNVLNNNPSWAVQMDRTEWVTSHRWIYTRNNRYGVSSVTDPNGECPGTTCLDIGRDDTANPNLDASRRPTPSSVSLINQGASTDPVPSDGVGQSGGLADIGRFEYGSDPIGDTGRYSYKPMWQVASLTPRLSWTFQDEDNQSSNAGQSQSAYEVQIDTVSRFDSLGDWKPLCSSGRVSSSQTFYDVPASCGLVGGGAYYFRVRTWDNVNASEPGLWSDSVQAFTVSDPGGTNNPPATPANARRTDVR